jgi:hypothetical protein
MSSFSTAYVVAPNISAATPYIPSPTQLNGAGPIVDLIPQIIRNVNTPTGVALDITPGSTTIVYTAPSSVSAGTYLVAANFSLTAGSSSSWSSSEAIICDIATTDVVGVITIPVVTVQPAYFSYFPALSQPVYLRVEGLLQADSGGTICCRVTRAGTGISANKFGDVFNLTVQKIE